MKKIMLLLFSFCALFIMKAQEKETIYIKYDRNDKISDSLNEIWFSISPNYYDSGSRADVFTYYKNKNSIKKVPYNQIKDKLITKEEANKLAKRYLTEFTKNSILKRIIFKLPIYFSSYFDNVYLYHLQTETLYEVIWESVIVD